MSNNIYVVPRITTILAITLYVFIISPPACVVKYINLTGLFVL